MTPMKTFLSEKLPIHLPSMFDGVVVKLKKSAIEICGPIYV